MNTETKVLLPMRKALWTQIKRKCLIVAKKRMRSDRKVKQRLIINKIQKVVDNERKIKINSISSDKAHRESIYQKVFLLFFIHSSILPPSILIKIDCRQVVKVDVNEKATTLTIEHDVMPN